MSEHGVLYRLIRTALALAFVAVMCAVIVGALVGFYMVANWVIGG